MGSETKTQKQTRGQLADALTTQRGAKEDFLNDPLFSGIRQIVEGIVAQPETFGPAQREALFRQTAGQANQEATQASNNLLASQTVGAGTRSGSTAGGLFDIGARLGETLAQSRRNIEIQGAQQDRQDQLGAVGAGQGILNLQNLLDQQIANAQLGAATTIASTGNQQSPGGALGGGLLGTAGNILTAGTSSKGLFKG